MRVLVVGAGAVGQVYGRHLQQGGARVSFFVKPKYAPAAREGFTVYPLNRADRTAPVTMRDFGVVTDLDGVRDGGFDQVWLAISAPALEGDWLPELLRAAGAPVVVSLVPGPRSRELLLRHVPEDRLVVGLINLISHQAPLPGETRFPEPGVAYWFPPRSASPFSGPDAPVREIVDTLRRGGQPATRAHDIDARQRVASAALVAFLLALESVDWSLARVRGELGDVGQAAREAVTVASRDAGERPPVARHALRGPVLRGVLAAAERIVPLDLEAYLRFHFTKVHDQTMGFARQLLSTADTRGIATPALAGLFARVSEESAA